MLHKVDKSSYVSNFPTLVNIYDPIRSPSFGSLIAGLLTAFIKFQALALREEEPSINTAVWVVANLNECEARSGECWCGLVL